MCGIAGIFRDSEVRNLDRLTSEMSQSLVHRGPDAGATWKSLDHRVALVHRRLSIVDLTDTGAQPMHSSCGRYVVIYNGEIYNADELRRELSRNGRSFRGHSDTEVIVEGFSQWGIRRTIEQTIGMFAIAVWDEAKRELSLIRDRIGIKPLYWSVLGGTFMFASELKALRAVNDWQPVLDKGAVASFLRHGYIIAPWTIYQGVFKLEPGTILKIDDRIDPVVEPYWIMRDAVAQGNARRPDYERRSDTEIIDDLEALLSDSVRRRMVADVPLGAFLSGGIDSSTVVAMMQKASSVPIRTFSIGFEEEEYNEAVYAKAVAAHLGTAHTELYVSSDDALSVIPKLPTIYDEPFADSSQIPTYLISILTRRDVTVALSGDGGDEIFAGYNRYFLADAMRRRLSWMAPSVRTKLGRALYGLADLGIGDRFFGRLPSMKSAPDYDRKLRTLGLMISETDEARYLRMIGHWTNSERVLAGSKDWESHTIDLTPANNSATYIEQMQYSDMRTYLPDDILAKVDRASMAVSLEVRVPLLDHRVVEFAWALPRRCVVRATQGKWALRQVLKRYVPVSLVDRRKMGFGVPIGRWLRHQLRDWAETLLSRKALDKSGYFNPEPIRRVWQEHLAGAVNHEYLLWDVLMFQAWLNEAKL